MKLSVRRTSSITHPGFDVGASSVQLETQRCGVFCIFFAYRLAVGWSGRRGARCRRSIWYRVLIVFEDEVHGRLEPTVICGTQGP